MVPLLLWSSLTSFGYFCGDGGYEAFCLAVDRCARAHTPRHLAPHGNGRGGCGRTSPRLVGPERGDLTSAVARWVAKGLSGFGVDHETSCQQVLKESGMHRAETPQAGRDQGPAGPLSAECRVGSMAVAFLAVETAALSCSGVDDLVTRLQRFTT